MLQQFTKSNFSVGGGSLIDLPMPTGGILVSVKATWIPATYISKGTANEQVVGADLKMLVTDRATNRSLIGQNSASDGIIIPSGGTWEWEHTDAIFLRSSVLVNKLRVNTAFGIFQADGVTAAGPRFTVAWDPILSVTHGVTIEAQVVLFDNNLT